MYINVIASGIEFAKAQILRYRAENEHEKADRIQEELDDIYSELENVRKHVLSFLKKI